MNRQQILIGIAMFVGYLGFRVIEYSLKENYKLIRKRFVKEDIGVKE